jgi:hypothetical protein
MSFEIGKSAKLTGQLVGLPGVAGLPIQLESSVGTATLEPTGTLLYTAASGKFSVAVSPRQATRYVSVLATTPALQTGEVVVAPRPKIKFYRNEKLPKHMKRGTLIWMDVETRVYPNTGNVPVTVYFDRYTKHKWVCQKKRKSDFPTVPQIWLPIASDGTLDIGHWVPVLYQPKSRGKWRVRIASSRTSVYAAGSFTSSTVTVR